jgi:hypothetical protein
MARKRRAFDNTLKATAEIKHTLAGPEWKGMNPYTSAVRGWRNVADPTVDVHLVP